MKATYFLSLLVLCLLSGLTAPAAPDTVSIYFPFNKSTLMEVARRQLDAAIYEGAISEKQPVQIIGYTDEVGGDRYNLHLSRLRAASVKAYLIQSGFSAGSIILITGKGEAGARTRGGPDGNPADRRVAIVKGMAAPQPESAKPVANIKSAKAEPRKISATDLRSVAVGETLLLDNIYFQAETDFILKDSYGALDAFVNSLQSAPKVRIRIEGHVCCASYTSYKLPTSLDTKSMNLSMARARAVYNLLVDRGIAAGRMEYAGFSYKRPLVTPEMNETDRAKNRRVEIRVIK